MDFEEGMKFAVVAIMATLASHLAAAVLFAALDSWLNLDFWYAFDSNMFRLTIVTLAAYVIGASGTVD